MKVSLILILLYLPVSLLLGQNNNQHTLVSSGNTIIGDGISIDWIVGENLLSPELSGMVKDTVSIDAMFHDFKAWPNVTRGKVYFYLNPVDRTGLYLEVTDLSGKLIQRTSWIAEPQVIDFTGLTAGFYLVKLAHEKNGQLASIKIVKF